MKMLQDYVVPFLRLENRSGRIHLGKHHGTAFFINSEGIFLTAGHVVRNCEAEISELGGFAGLSVRGPDNEYRVVGRVVELEFADPPYDLAIGRIDRASRACFLFDPEFRAWTWEDIYTAGYPESAVHRDGERFLLDARGHKGQVLRTIQQGRVLMHPHPTVIEVSFPIAQGMSGSPLVLRDLQDDAGKLIPYFGLLGVCVGNQSSRLVEHSITEVTDDGAHLREEVARIEKFGLVHDLRPLAEWSPAILGATTLKSAIRPSD